MTQIITNGRFDGKNQDYVLFSEISDWQNFEGNVEVTSDTHPDEIIKHLNKISAIKVQFPTSADGRGSSIAKALRMAGFTGPLRASGHILSDQYPLILRSGFDDVEIDVELAARQPETQWAESLLRVKNNYLARLNSRKEAVKTAA